MEMLQVAPARHQIQNFGFGDFVLAESAMDLASVEQREHVAMG